MGKRYRKSRDVELNQYRDEIQETNDEAYRFMWYCYGLAKKTGRD